ncbi:glycosyltransferase family 2 protein [Vibrio sp. 10N.222.55.C7]|uniref:glycosyltransferase family 2 protein n=1 Tax=Vibrio sp. 10N.222.55.C7 TaxID=3229650 RepID=UPI00354D7C56
MHRKPKVSIIIPAYNAQKYIKDTLMSCCNQTYDNVEIVVIDDGSDDKTLEVVKSINSDNIIILNQKNQGVTTARENGIQNCNGEFLFFLDSDDILDEKAIDILLSYYLENNSDIVIGQSKSFGYGSSRKSKYKEGIYNEPFSQFLMCSLPFTLWPSLYRRELFNCLEYDYELKVGEDYMIICQIIAKSSSVTVCSDVIHYYRRHKDSVTATPSKIKFYDSYRSFKYVIDFSESSALPLKDELIYHQVQYLYSQEFSGSPYSRDIKRFLEKKIGKKDIEKSLIDMGVPKYIRIVFKYNLIFNIMNFIMRQVRRFIQKVRLLK